MESIIQPIETAFSSVGLTTPVTRGAAMALVGGALEYYFKPSYSYRPDGTPRPTVYLQPGAADATYLPAGSTAILTGLFFSLFV